MADARAPFSERSFLLKLKARALISQINYSDRLTMELARGHEPPARWENRSSTIDVLLTFDIPGHIRPRRKT